MPVTAPSYHPREVKLESSKSSENNNEAPVESDAEQAVLEVLVPPLLPLQPHVQGPEPANDASVPAEQRFGSLDVKEENACPLSVPQAPLIAVVIVTFADLEVLIFPAASLAHP